MGVLSEMSAQDHRTHPFYHEAILFESAISDPKILSL